MASLALVATLSGKASESLSSHDGVRELLARPTIRIESQGTVLLDYARGLTLLKRPGLLSDAQAAYEAILPVGEKAEFVVRETVPGFYTFVNRKGQHSAIEEINRGEKGPDDFRMALFVEGERWFGQFRSLIRIQVRPNEDWTGCVYRIEVDAYPENALLRGLARLGPIRRFFTRKTRAITDLAVDVIAALDQRILDTEVAEAH